MGNKKKLKRLEIGRDNLKMASLIYKKLGSRDSNPNSMLQRHMSCQLDDFPIHIYYYKFSFFCQEKLYN